MTDAELIARLRDDSGNWLTDAAADRIEALEAKLAKAVEALEQIAGNGNAAGRNPQIMADIAFATLAEISSHNKGESREVPER